MPTAATTGGREGRVAARAGAATGVIAIKILGLQVEVKGPAEYGVRKKVSQP